MSKRSDLAEAIITHQSAFRLSLKSAQIARLESYYDLIQEHNPLLHLVGPCSAEEFAVRHILESLTLLEHLPLGARFVDVGTGAGLPALPCLLVRNDLTALLIESKEKKSAFLSLAVGQLDLTKRARIFPRQFQEADLKGWTAVTCRALDKFTEKLPRLLSWSKGRKLLLFGGDNLQAALQGQKVEFVRELMPLSERRYLFVLK